MVTEIARITVAPGREEEFDAAMRSTGLVHLCACPGVISARFGRGVERPSTFAFVVEWASIEAHAAAKDTVDFTAFRAAMGDMGIGGEMDHFTLS